MNYAEQEVVELVDLGVSRIVFVGAKPGPKSRF